MAHFGGGLPGLDSNGTVVIQRHSTQGTTVAAGVRAWLSPANLIFGIIISICAVFAFGCSFPAVFGLILLALLAFPIIDTIMQTPIAATPPREAENLTAEREKVLSMLEAGKITAEESAELLNALAATKTPEPPRGAIKISPQRRFALLGAALVLIGFFLPWFSINPGKEISRMTGQMQGMINGMIQNIPGYVNGEPPLPPGYTGQPSFTVKTQSINIVGGDVAHGLGWLVLVFSLGVAVLPFVAENLDTHTQRTIALLALSVGTIVLIYLLATNVRFLSAGIILAVAGYLVEFASTLKSTSPAAFLPTMRENASS